MRPIPPDSFARKAIIVLGLFGAALFYGDGVITPAISVLSAVEGLEVATPAFKPFVLPISLVILVALFAVQRRGTASVGTLFGPIMVLWFLTLGVLGIISIAHDPGVLRSLNPWHAVRFFEDNPVLGFFALGASVLALTGAEALYADMGHFGRKPIQLAWFALVLPTLVLNYFGQGALLLRDPAAIANPFYLLAPDWLLLPMVMLATVATVIASQAVISGAFSMTQQAIQLGFSPRMEISHTSDEQIGQIYLGGINWTLLVAVVALVIGLRQFVESGRSLWHRRHGHHVHHRPAGLCPGRAMSGAGRSGVRCSARCPLPSSTWLFSPPIQSRSPMAAGSP